ncbi:hypothetical protein TIFTF001_023659 [Ficus carica]|uniref:Uncharacterized protein n=1 Tax=Ficus carica TaxID=3494 RepID=A0AA88DFG6_FICCA|nr:hypothetical protein TIFTF001_023659 [Ficus carica]
MELDFKNCTGNRKILYRISGNNTAKEYSTQQCPGRIKLDIGHREHKQGKYNSAYSIGFVVYTCLTCSPINKNKIKYETMQVMMASELARVLPTRAKSGWTMVNNLLATDDARWKGEAWRTVKCGDQAATHFEFL